MRIHWDDHFMTRAYLNAEQSTCWRRNVGAVATRANRSVADGFNGNLPGFVHCTDGGCDRCDDPNNVTGLNLGRCVCVHAEQNIVAYCASSGTPLAGTTVYCTTRPCLDCLKLLISAKVERIVFDEDYVEELPADMAKFLVKWEGVRGGY